MKQKAVVMATVFTMMLAVGATGLSTESLHQHPAYTSQQVRMEVSPKINVEALDRLLLTASVDNEK